MHSIVQLEKDDPVDTEHQYDKVDLLENTFTVTDGAYQFLGYEFQCGADMGFSKLFDLNNSGGTVNLTFAYSGEGKVTLTRWNQ
ncbi:hypothetical protein N473_21510 [Pseudoalteromonas luteoviolacea CPMOR-1]|uniref:Uncharacterized protein n=1 Tax=Pseudoalteromonas luteoviolacea CPMOR-1 TaxID=1365248 RepID=A0A167K4K9_9GAMM|nr:hypothetical protein [Pseudoalteromonas luteoviolacea]KZN62126.1 hypothetical protein N473_21510 [Pseudoalteromonas luteoviolacea CPMOR-1]